MPPKETLAQETLTREAKTIEKPFAAGQSGEQRSFGAVPGKPISIGTGFEALSFKHAMFAGAMDPLVMIDHYIMAGPTFGAHPHAGISAVTVLFEDSQGTFNNRDSLGNDIDLKPGDLYWLKAGRGAVHDEKPTLSSRAHGLQLFVNLPAGMKQDAPQSLHVKAADMPIFERAGASVRVVLGDSNGLSGARPPALPMTILDARLDAHGQFAHEVPSGHAALLVCISGTIEVDHGEGVREVAAGQALAIEARREPFALALRTDVASQAALVTSEPIGEDFVQRGPFVMSTKTELDQVEADYRAGLLGTLTDEQSRE
ncbi:pirin family protein [Parasphingopyxis marina]|uniref:Pirin family protein n=1 Tax=Parasphingopyxis marina TaxID=2761622 RepID=A0A842HS99_9SPHN|nr:pirin-like C-terminal cupin domain-containing protein [Parasphingopyxis marina]MBC2776718.1 pirin family protein [Parasphingopyxis marina]